MRTSPPGEPSGTTRNRTIVACSVLFVITILVRLPFFFPAVIDWDESTFVLIGQSVVDGHLPY